MRPMLAIVILLACWSIPSTVSAEPLYLKVYKETFPRVNFYRCDVCHTSESKRALNPYGQSVHERLEYRRTKDVLLIRRVLEELGPAPDSK